MLDQPYKDKLSLNVNRMVEIRLANPLSYKTDQEWNDLAKENKHLEAQIATYRNLIGLKPNQAHEFTKTTITESIQQIYAKEQKQ
jgi:hypothetical protein